MPCRVQQEDGQQNCLWRPLIEPRNNVESGCNPEHERAEKKIDGEDIHSIPRKPDALAYYAGPLRHGSTKRFGRSRVASQEQPKHQAVCDQQQWHKNGHNEVSGTELTRFESNLVALIEGVEEVC